LELKRVIVIVEKASRDSGIKWNTRETLICKAGIEKICIYRNIRYSGIESLLGINTLGVNDSTTRG
jgi:hypothetical protein